MPFSSIKLIGEKRFVNSVKVFAASIKWINPVQKYPQIIESYACILKIFALIFLLSINYLISFGICSTPKESKQVTSLLFTHKGNQWVPISEYSSRFVT